MASRITQCHDELNLGELNLPDSIKENIFVCRLYNCFDDFLNINEHIASEEKIAIKKAFMNILKLLLPSIALREELI